MIAAQQYFIEYNSDMNSERLLNLLPNYIPDYCLSNAEKSVERWKQLVVQAYKKVNILQKIQLAVGCMFTIIDTVKTIFFLSCRVII